MSSQGGSAAAERCLQRSAGEVPRLAPARAPGAWCGKAPNGQLVLQTLYEDEAVAWRRVIAGFYCETRARAEAAGWSVVRVSLVEAA